ncbi:MAG: DNA repair protein RadA [Prevotella sp.]|nr:DNA repair protein RadA [Candidatus Prevotella equi]
MAKTKTAYVCDNCGQDSAKWMGKCPTCGQWNTFREIRISNEVGQQSARTAARDVIASHSTAMGKSAAMRLRDISTKAEPRMDMGDEELNRVLGGGLVPGSIILLGGDPGIGKSTLTLQTIMRLKDKEILYVSGEESAHQLRMRAERLARCVQGISNNEEVVGEGVAGNDNVLVLCETSIEKIFDQIRDSAPDLVVIDSIQTMETETVDSAPGSVTQIRECAAALLRFAKASGVPVILIGHINKEGTIAGPKILEHIVDAVIQFEGDRQGIYRILRSIKNRFGSTSELGIYEMLQNGLRPVSNPSELLLSDDREGMSGIAIASAVEGMRPFLVEAQALVSTAAYGTPQRSATGFDQRRLNMLLAVLEKRVGFKLVQKDVFVNIAGGLKVTDMAMDLSVLAAIFSSNVDMPIEDGWCMCGEVGLSGEVRPVSRIEQRISEAEKLGFTNIIIPKRSLAALQGKNYSIKLHPVRKVEEALRMLFG